MEYGYIGILPTPHCGTCRSAMRSRCQPWSLAVDTNAVIQAINALYAPGGKFVAVAYNSDKFFQCTMTNHSARATANMATIERM
jgi:hypothetical protein